MSPTPLMCCAERLSQQDLGVKGGQRHGKGLRGRDDGGVEVHDVGVGVHLAELHRPQSAVSCLAFARLGVGRAQHACTNASCVRTSQTRHNKH